MKTSRFSENIENQMIRRLVFCLFSLCTVAASVAKFVQHLGGRQIAAGSEVMNAVPAVGNFISPVPTFDDVTHTCRESMP